MAKFMLVGSYTAQGAKGVLGEGGSSRREAARRLVESVGGQLESFYYGFGEDDFYVTYDAPGAAAASALALTVGSSGAVSGRTIALITPEEIDEAARIRADYTPPGG